MTLIEFTIDGDSSATGAQTFTLQHSYTFRTLRLKHVIYSIANDNLYQQWASSTAGVSTPDRYMYAPLYLDVSNIAAVQDHYMYHSASANNAKGMVAIGSASYEAGPSTPGVENSHYVPLNMDLIKGTSTTWAKDATITLAVKYSSVETAGAFGAPAAFDANSWDDTCRITAVFELDEMQQFEDAENNVLKTYRDP